MSSKRSIQPAEDLVQENDKASIKHHECLEKDIGLKSLYQVALAVDISHISEQEKKRILHKVDWRVVPLLSFLYLVSFIDRGNRKIGLL
jgi:hypothetical protein